MVITRNNIEDALEYAKGAIMDITGGSNAYSSNMINRYIDFLYEAFNNYRPDSIYPFAYHMPFNKINQFMLPRTTDQIPLIWHTGKKWVATYFPPMTKASVIFGNTKIGWASDLLDSSWTHYRRGLPTRDYNQLLFGSNINPDEIRVFNFVGHPELDEIYHTNEEGLKRLVLPRQDGRYPAYGLIPIGKGDFYIVPFMLVANEKSQTVLSFEFETSVNSSSVREEILNRYWRWLNEKSIERFGFRLPFNQLRKGRINAYHDSTVYGRNPVELVHTGATITNMIFAFHYWSELMRDYIEPGLEHGHRKTVCI